MRSFIAVSVHGGALHPRERVVSALGLSPRLVEIKKSGVADAPVNPSAPAVGRPPWV